MKKFMMAALVFTLWTPVARPQNTPVLDVSVGYSAIKVDNGDTFTAYGGSSTVALNLNHWLAAVGDFGLYHTSYIAPGLAAGTYTFGPRFSYRHWDRVTPFAQVLLGGARSGVNALAFGTGGGADIALDKRGRFAVRPQLEYFGFRANGSATNTLRVGIGLVFRIGKR
jgi:outer membrane immunogenic protein